jgi:outer membrane protein TolC
VRLLTSVATVLALSGCMVGPNFVAPRPAVPDQYISDAPVTRGAVYISGDAVDPVWWNSFHDPELSKLESLAVTQNLDLREELQQLGITT